MRGSKIFVRGGQTLIRFFFIIFFLVDEGLEDPNATMSGPSSACQRNVILLTNCSVKSLKKQKLPPNVP